MIRKLFVAWHRHGFRVKEAIDEVIGGMDADVYLPVSFAHRILLLILAVCLLHFERLGVRAPESRSSLELQSIRPPAIASLWRERERWRIGFQVIRAPP